MRQSIAASAILCTFFTLIITVVTCSLTHPILVWVKTPADIYEDAYAYVFIILLGTGATFFYNMISNILRSLGDSKTPLYYLIFSSVLNVVLDIVFLVPLHMGVAGAAWATVLAQLISSVLCLISGLRKFSVLHLTSRDFRNLKSVMVNHLKIGFPMGFQMSVMCIGLLSMQSSVNALGSVAVAGYTAATKADQISVLVNNALSAALASFVSQNYGAGRMDRVRQGVRANLIQTEVLNLLMCAGILLFRNHIVAFFVSDPTPEMITYSNMYVHVVAPCYLLLGALSVFRCAIQSMQNSLIPFLACIIELFCRIISTKAVCAAFGYIGVCLATPLAWVGACTLLIPSYFVVISKSCLAKNSTQ